MTANAMGANMPDSTPVPRRGRAAVERERLTRILRDPKGYYADARQWASGKARADLQRELAVAARRRSNGSGWYHWLLSLRPATKP